MKKIFIYILLTLSIKSYSDNLHPNFNITIYDLKKVVSHEKDEIQNNILNEPVAFLSYIEQIIKNSDIDLSLVDKEHRLDGDYIPHDLINLSDYDLNTRYKTMLFSRVAIEDFIDMSRAAKVSGVDIFIASTYRSYEFQDQIFNNMKKYHGEKKASTIVAYPGASQHQLGLSVDFGSITQEYAKTDAGKWLKENAWKYGFTLSYPKGLAHITTYMWEPWHYRYIGHAAAFIQTNYFKDIQHLFLLFWHKYRLFFIENHIQ